MSMRARMSLFQKTLGWFLGSVLAFFSALLVGAFLVQASDAALGAAVLAATTVLGLAWLILGWAFVPSVETYLGPGASRGIPILSPSLAIPERNSPVLKDLKSKLSGQTDMGIAFALLGFLLMVVGFLFYAAPTLGLILLLAFLACLVSVLGYTLLPRPAASRAEQAKPPANP